MAELEIKIVLEKGVGAIEDKSQNIKIDRVFIKLVIPQGRVYLDEEWEVKLKGKGTLREEIGSEECFVNHGRIVETQEGKVEESKMVGKVE